MGPPLVVSDISPTVDRGVASLIEKKTLKKRISNHEYRMSNIEGRHSINFYLLRRQSAAKPPFEILRFDIRYSAVRCLTNPGLDMCIALV